MLLLQIKKQDSNINKKINKILYGLIKIKNVVMLCPYYQIQHKQNLLIMKTINEQKMINIY